MVMFTLYSSFILLSSERSILSHQAHVTLGSFPWSWRFQHANEIDHMTFKQVLGIRLLPKSFACRLILRPDASRLLAREPWQWIPQRNTTYHSLIPWWGWGPAWRRGCHICKMHFLEQITGTHAVSLSSFRGAPLSWKLICGQVTQRYVFECYS